MTAPSFSLAHLWRQIEAAEERALEDERWEVVEPDDADEDGADVA